MNAGKANHLRSSFFSLSAVCGISCSPSRPSPRFMPLRNLQSRRRTLPAKRFCKSTKCLLLRAARTATPRDAPLQGDDSHIHLQNVKRGKDGHGVYGMRCDACHQSANLAGANMPPGIRSGRFPRRNTRWFSWPHAGRAMPPAQRSQTNRRPLACAVARTCFLR